MTSKISRLRRAAFYCFAVMSASAFADSAFAQTAFRMVSWAAPATNEDGSPLTDLMGYYIYTGDSPESLIPRYFSTPDELRMLLVLPNAGARYYAVTAVNVDGVESEMSPVMRQ
jgi:hypothetical protein